MPTTTAMHHLCITCDDATPRRPCSLLACRPLSFNQEKLAAYTKLVRFTSGGDKTRGVPLMYPCVEAFRLSMQVGS